MTRPEQPREYGQQVVAVPRPGQRREYKDQLGRPYSGLVRVFLNGDLVMTLPLVAGAVELTLPPGSYRLVAEVRDVENVLRYIDDQVEVAKYL